VLAHAHLELQGAKFVVFADGNRRYVDCSEAACGLLGYTREKLLSKTFVLEDGCNAAVWDPIKDWRPSYLAALLELDRSKLKSKVELALADIQAARAGTDIARTTRAASYERRGRGPQLAFTHHQAQDCEP
jgi:PAS domain-containing protein